MFVRSLVREALDLSEIYANYVECQGNPPYDPSMMTALLLYSYTQGVYASRRIARACEQRLDYMAITAHQSPDFRTVAKFRKRHLEALKGLFVQVVNLCREAGMVKLGHVAIDGTKVKANASKHKAMSYGRMEGEEKRLREEVEEWFRQAEVIDEEEDKVYGKHRRGDELPEWVKNKEERTKRIREAKKALETQARGEKQDKELPPKSRRGKKKGEEDFPHDKDQYNFTDPESSIMKSKGSFEQCYNAQVAVDGANQVIVVCAVTNQAGDTAQLMPMVEAVEEATGELPKELSADAGYSSEDNLAHLAEKPVSAYIAPGRENNNNGKPEQGTYRHQMWKKLRQGAWRTRYRLRKSIVEPVFGQIKHCREFRQFLLRGVKNVQAEWALVCTAHNILKLAKSDE